MCYAHDLNPPPQDMGSTPSPSTSFAYPTSPPSLLVNTPSSLKQSPNLTTPYRPRTAYPGLIPTPPVDIPLCAIFLLFFLLPIPLNLTLHHLSLYRHRHPDISTRPLLPALLSTFCALRILALSLRIAWSLHPSNLRLEIASVVLSTAGIALLYITNLILTRRWVRDYAIFGYRTLVKGFFRFWAAVVIICLVMAVVVSVNRYFTHDEAILQECRNVVLVASAVLTLVALLPVLTVGGVMMGGMEDREAVGREYARVRARRGLLVVTGVLLTVEAGFRLGVRVGDRPWGGEGWYHSRAAYYCLGYMLEVVVVWLLTGARVWGGFRTGEVYKGHWPGGGRPRVERWAEWVNTEGEVYGERG